MPCFSKFFSLFHHLNSIIFSQAEKGSAKVKIQEVLLEMRKYRSGLIQTRDQLRFAYRAIIQGAKLMLNLSHDDEEEDDNYDTSDTKRLLGDEVPRQPKKPRSDGNNADGGPQLSPPNESLGVSNNNLTSATELRQRIREEKKRKMTDKIKTMKEKQKESESRLRTKNFLIKVGIFSLGLIATASLAYYFWPSSIEVSVRVESQLQDNLVKLMSDNDSLPDPSIPRVVDS